MTHVARLHPIRRLAVALIATLSLVLGAPGAHGQVLVFSSAGEDAHAINQLALVEFDRPRGLVHITHNALVRRSRAGAFAILVATPVAPILTEAPESLWIEARTLTSSHRSVDTGCSFGFDESPPRPPGSLLPGSDDVTDYGPQIAAIQSSSILPPSSGDPATAWLTEHGYQIDSAQSAVLRSYSDRGWYFAAIHAESDSTADPTYVQLSPLTLTYSADSVQFPFASFLNRVPERSVLVVYVVDQHRAMLRGLETAYANRLNAAEHAAMVRSYPRLAARIPEGAFVTRLEKLPWKTLDSLATIRRAASDEELLTVFYGDGSWKYVSGDVLLLIAVPCTILARMFRSRHKRR